MDVWTRGRRRRGTGAGAGLRVRGHQEHGGLSPGFRSAELDAVG